MKTKTAIVVAHPDDEVLWFSSVVEQADIVVVSFCDSARFPKLGKQRRDCLREYPLNSFLCLYVPQSDTFGGADWQRPQMTQWGIGIVRPGFSDKRYRENYHDLKELLTPLLDCCQIVYTHSPWGDYGSEDHIQIHKIVSEISAIHGFEVRFPNYCSDRSLHLMRNYLPQLGAVSQPCPTKPELADLVADLYRKHDCWTWYENWETLPAEFFLHRKPEGICKRQGTVQSVPLNLIFLDPSYTLSQQQRAPRLSLSGRIRKLPAKIWHRVCDKLDKAVEPRMNADVH